MHNVTIGDILFIVLTFLVIHGILRLVHTLRDRKKDTQEGPQGET